MPRNIIGRPPFKLVTFETDRPISTKQFNSLFQNKKSISLCIRSETGHPSRGGYFFHIERKGDAYQVLDFQGTVMDTLDGSVLIRFVNHVSGRLFDPEMLVYCQSTVNFRQDQKDSE